MTTGRGPQNDGYLLLEKLTAIVLVIVDVGLGWLLVASYWPGMAGSTPTSVLVVLAIVLLTVALIMVSMVAILHTRDSG